MGLCCGWTTDFEQLQLKRRDHMQSAWQDGQVEYLTAAHQAGVFACVALGCNAAWEAFEEWLTRQARS